MLQIDIMLDNALVHMYAKCRALAKEAHVPERLSSKDGVSWRPLIVEYAPHVQEILIEFKFEMYFHGMHLLDGMTNMSMMRKLWTMSKRCG